jgi:hypothetical protein
MADHITQRLARIAEELTSKSEELCELSNELHAIYQPRPARTPATRNRIHYIDAAYSRLCDALDELKDAQELTT